MSTKTILIVYLIAALAIGCLLYARNRAFQHAEHEFDQLACLLEAAVTECLQEYDACDTAPDPECAVERLSEKYKREGLLDYMEEDYQTLRQLVARMARLTIPGNSDQLLACHERLLLLGKSLDACNFPHFCKRVTAWTPGTNGFSDALITHKKRR